MKTKFSRILLAFLVLGLATLLNSRAPRATVVPVDLRCEYRQDPVGIDEKAPRLSWRLLSTSAGTCCQRQTAYRLLVSSSQEKLANDQGDLWDSGLVSSSQSQLVVYQGSPLTSGLECFWKIRVKDERGGLSQWSKSARWTMGLLSPSDWTARWIGSDNVFVPQKGSPPSDNTVPDPWFRKAISLPAKPLRATIYVASVGYHELYVNGAKIGDGILTPAATDHTKRARYVTYEIADHLRPGRNILGLWLGVSWSIFPPYETDDKPRTPLVIAQANVRFGDGRSMRIVTDESWRTHPSPNRLLGTWYFGNFGGELYDANLEVPGWSSPRYDDAGWQPATVYRPKLVLSAQQVELNRPVKEIRPVAVEHRPDSTYRVDMGVNFAGWTEILVRGRPGERIDFEFSEREDRTMTFRNRSAYVIGPKGHGTFRNRFNYSSARWITIKGLAQRPDLADIRGWMVRTNFERAGSFESSSPRLNWIYDTTLWTFENLSLGGYVVDCPQRERLGYGGDAHASTETGLFNYGLGALYTKWSEDWRDVQGRDSLWDLGKKEGPGTGERLHRGVMPHTAPTYSGGGGPAWGGYCVTLPWLLYQHYGDRRILEKNFRTIHRWLGFLESKTQGDLLTRFGGQWDFLGDWLWPGAKGVNNETSETLFFNNCYWIYSLRTAARIAEILGHVEDAQRWRKRAASVRAAAHARFFNSDDHSYVNGSMAYLAIALLVELPPPELRPGVMRRLEHEILVVRKSHIDAGITGGAFLFKMLREVGRNDLLLAMVNQEGYPGWSFMRSCGATTFWEAWEENRPGHSLLHSSYLYPGAWFIDGLAGIQRDPERSGFQSFVIRPPRLEEPTLTWVKAAIDSQYGRIESHWRKDKQSFHLEIAVPPNTTATVYIPASSRSAVGEDWRGHARAGSVRWIRDQDGYAVFEVQPGRYRFRADRGAE